MKPPENEGGDARRAGQIVPKPWGQEFIWAKTDRYVGKILTIRGGESLSLQYHRVKDETIMLLSGDVMLEYSAIGEQWTIVDLVALQPFHIPPTMRHRLSALADSEVLEVSTPELDDVVRIADRYGRTAETDKP